MKKTILTALFCATAILSIAAPLSITAVQPSYDNLPEEARQALETKLEQILTANNFTSGMSDCIVLTAKYNIAQKDIMPSQPPRVSERLNVTLFVGNTADNTVYAKTTIQTAGIGVTETKALIQAFQHISVNNPAIQQLLTDASAQIIDYYTNHCDVVLAEANRLAATEQYDAAIAKLISVPDACTACYTTCQDRAVELYLKKADINCQSIIQQARTTWAGQHDYDTAIAALNQLSAISPEASCNKEAKQLIAEISSALRDKEKADFEFQQQQYQDRIAFRNSIVSACQAIGVAFGNGLPKTVTKVVRHW